MKKSKFAVPFPNMPEISGISMSAVESGIKYNDRLDLMLVEFCEDTQVVGVFTKSQTASYSVEWCRECLNNGIARGLVVNSGNANVFTGSAGIKTVEETAKTTANIIDCIEKKIFVSSTGVIGEVLPYEKITSQLPTLKQNLSSDSWKDIADAINTTDTFTKGVTKIAMIDGVEVKINGIAKGSGMIAPNMATMLAYIFTDANISSHILQELLSNGSEKSFNSITVDSDTSTSDTVLLFATCKAEHRKIQNTNDRLLDFKAKLNELLLELAHLVVKDGEGISKFVTINVKGAVSDKSAKSIGLTIANSPLVKTAIAGEDPNWGRIVMAVGKTDEPVECDKLSIWIGDILIAQYGELDPSYKEEEAVKYMKGDNIEITVDIGIGQGGHTVWTTDLTHEYITINADYRS